MVFVPTQINIGSMKLNNADHAGMVSFGSTFAVNRSVSAKKTQGIGQQLADGVVSFSTLSMVLDDDLSDVFNEKIGKGGI
jgi:hypothetical protein